MGVQMFWASELCRNNIEPHRYYSMESEKSVHQFRTYLVDQGNEMMNIVIKWYNE